MECETSVFDVETNTFLEYECLVIDVIKSCEMTLQRKKSKGRGCRSRESEYKVLCSSICRLWIEMEGLFADRHVFGSMVTAKLKTDWSKRVIAREMSTILESLESKVIGVLGEGVRKGDVEATLGWSRELLTLDGVFARPSGDQHPMNHWVDAQINKMVRFTEVMKSMECSSRRIPRGRDEVTPMDFIFAIAAYNSAVHLAR